MRKVAFEQRQSLLSFSIIASLLPTFKQGDAFPRLLNHRLIDVASDARDQFRVELPVKILQIVLVLLGWIVRLP